MLQAVCLLALAAAPATPPNPPEETDPATLLTRAAFHEVDFAQCPDAMRAYQRFFAVCANCELLRYGEQRFEAAIERCALPSVNATGASEVLSLLADSRVLRRRAMEILAGRDPEVAKIFSQKNNSCLLDENMPPGFITVSTKPWGRLFVNDKEVGQTPMSRIKVASGCAELRVVGEDGKERTVTVSIKPNVVQIYSFTLE